MIEIPTLEESGHSRQELEQLQQRFAQPPIPENPGSDSTSTQGTLGDTDYPSSASELPTLTGQISSNDLRHEDLLRNGSGTEHPLSREAYDPYEEHDSSIHIPDISDNGASELNQTTSRAPETPTPLGPAFDYSSPQSPLSYAPHLVNAQLSPLPSDQYFSNKYHQQADTLTPEQTIYENSDAFMIHPSDDSHHHKSAPSNASISLSEYAREVEIEPPIMEQTTIHMTPIRASPAQVSLPQGSHPLRNMLASSPENDIDAPAHMESVSDFEAPDDFDTSGQFNYLQASTSGVMLHSQQHALQTPLPPQGHNFVEPSPQLPPPLSAKSSKLSFSHREEFTQMRRVMATEQKTPAEYTLHIVFTQFVRHAERKLNMCLDYPLSEEPPILELLAQGADPKFDNVVSALGYIAKRKPKPVIDSVMFWRKSKSEVAAMAASEVEKIYSVAKGDLARIATSTSSMTKNSRQPSSPKSNKPPSRGKRSLSLMHSKSLSRLTHKRNNSASVVPTTSNDAKSSLDASSITESSEYSRQKQYYDDQITQARDTAIQAERKSLASIYILCRVLIEVVRQTSSEAVGDDLGGKLEEIVYTQLKTTDPVTTKESFVRSANWNLFSELLGHMSEKRFLSVSDRFIADLEKIPSNVKQTEEPKICLLIHGMSRLRLSIYPLEKFEESGEFLQSITKFYSASQNHGILIAYTKVLIDLITPLATTLTAEANHPLWVETTAKIFEKASWLCSLSSMKATNGASPATSSTPRPASGIRSKSDWALSIELMTAALTVAPKELFATHWFEMLEQNATKLKPKGDIADKTTLIVCASRLLWVYMNRLPDTLNNTIKRLDSFFELIFFGPQVSGKKQWIVLDTSLINALSEVIRIVGFYHFNYVLDNVILKLLKGSFNGQNLENASPEKLILVIESYMLCLKDAKSGEKPKFPTDSVFQEEFAFQLSSANIGKKASKIGLTREQGLHLRKWNKFMFDFKNIKNFESHEDICRTIAVLFKLLDSQCGMSGWTSSEGPASVGNSMKSSFSGFSFGLDFSYQNSRDVYKDLFSATINACPWSVVPFASDKGGASIGMSFKACAEILIRNSIHSNPQIANASVNALFKLASRRNAGDLITIFGKVAFRLTEKPGPHYDADYFNSEEFLRLLRIYVELLNCWSNQFTSESEDLLAESNGDNELMNNDVLNDLYQINYKAPDLTNLDVPTSKYNFSEELEWKNIVTVIEEVEGNGLFFLCSQDSQVRALSLSILRAVEQFDQSLYDLTDKKGDSNSAINGSSPKKGHSRTSSKYVADEGTRLIHVLEKVDLMSLLKPLKRDLSVPERTMLSKIKTKKGLLTKFASSDHGIDSTIWFRIYPKLLDIFFEKCPMPVAMCRSIVCVRLVQMHELVLEFSDSFKNYTSSLFTRSSSSAPPEVLINQWKLYLVFACCSLTSTNDQKISFPNQPTHGHKKSMTMYIQHQKITSAKSVFRMVFPLLRSLRPMIREAVIAGLSSININTFKTLVENLPECVRDWDSANQKRDASEDRVRIEAVHILSIITSRFRSNDFLYDDESTVSSLVSLIKNVKSFLSESFVQTSPEFQRLRCYFAALLENVFLGLKERDDLNSWLPFEARIGCFNYLKEWCGFGDSKEILEERIQIMTRAAESSREPVTAVGLLELDIKSLQIAALSCMATICSGALKQSLMVPGKTAVLSFDIKSVMSWVHEIIQSPNERVHEMGKAALKNIIDININSDDIYEEVFRQCYNPENSTKVMEVYYTSLVPAFLKHREVDSMPYDLFCLSTFLVGTDSYQTRVSAIECLKTIESRFLETTTADYFTESVCCTTMVVYKKVLFEISVKLASLHSKDAFMYISLLTKYFNLVDNTKRRDILACLLPWVQTVDLKYKSNEVGVADSTESQTLEIDMPSLMVLNNLFEITVKFSKMISNEVEALWVALGTKQGNFDIIVDYIMRNCLERRSSSFVSYSRQIIAYLVYSQPDPSVIIGKMIGNLQPKAMVPHPHSMSAAKTADVVDGFPYTANLTGLLSHKSKESAFSLGQLSMVFLVDLFRSNNEMIIPHLPLLLHVCFSLLDHYFYVVQEQAASLLIHLVHSIDPGSQKSIQVIEILRQKDHAKHLWVYDDLNNDKKGGITPRNMDSLVRKILEIFAPSVPNLQADWSRVSLKWATTCAVRHIACRSFQIFRSLLSFLDQSMLKDMLHRLSNTVADESTDIQGFAMQILMTLNAITAELDSENLIDFPQLFWSSVACLSTIHEHEFIETVSTMSKFVSKIDLDAPDTISCLISTFPPKWEGKFEGLQQIVMVGLRSSAAWEPTIKFLDKLNHLQDSEIIGSGDHRLFAAIISNLPRFLHALEEQKITPEIENACNLIGEMAAGCNKPALARILNSLAKSRFRSKKDFLVQTISTIKTSFFPEYEAQALVSLLSLLSNELPWVKFETLNILKQTLPLIDLSKDEFLGVGADLISPLLRLLLTEYAEPALEVLDEAAVISGSQLDNDILRMSLGNTSMKKEYEQTATLFGIPEPSGWAIPMPAVTAASTRNNIHAVFETCNESSAIEEKQKDFADEDIEFLMEDYYEPEADHADAISTANEVPGATLSNMWAALDDFDSFFTKDTEQRAQIVSTLANNGRGYPSKTTTYHAQSASTDTKESNSSDLMSPIESAPHVYDKKALVILNRSLARTQSNTSFKSSLADNFGSPTTYGPRESPGTRRSYIPFRTSRVAK